MGPLLFLVILVAVHDQRLAVREAFSSAS